MTTPEFPQGTALATVRSYTLPDEQQLRHDLAAIGRFQAVVRAQLKLNHDYGVIPGTGNKPTLLKPGAEKIVKLLGLSDTYEIVERVEDWDRPLFRYLLKCRLISIAHGEVISEGLGECNTMESKYRWRWVWADNLPDGYDKAKAVTRTVRNGGKQYRLENDDIYSQLNTILKMAKKRALVDAALSAGRLSDLFTQDLEDLRANAGVDADESAEASAPTPAAPAQPAPRTVPGEARPVDPPPATPGIPATGKQLADAIRAKGWTAQQVKDALGGGSAMERLTAMTSDGLSMADAVRAIWDTLTAMVAAPAAPATEGA